MVTRRTFLQQGLGLTATAFLGTPLIGCAARSATHTATAGAKPVAHAAAAKPARPATQQAQLDGGPAPRAELDPPPDIFDAQALDLEFWLKPRVIEVTRPASGERAKILYWKDGDIIDSAYQELCHLMRDVNGKETAPIDPKLFETLWGTQAFVARYGIEQPLEILSGYRTATSNRKLIESGVPAARQSLHIEGRAADIRIANLNAEVLGGLVRSFRQGGVGFYYRAGPRGGWIHADTGLKRTWKG
ncbi:YcbK family protein [Rugamonas apoptosis]|uniref:YcbK family protein n=1 Tax=Rugamonas apoptosis TaxID=2758570 RepID=UPI0035CCE749